jgi:hypothetical protein
MVIDVDLICQSGSDLSMTDVSGASNPERIFAAGDGAARFFAQGHATAYHSHVFSNEQRRKADRLKPNIKRPVRLRHDLPRITQRDFAILSTEDNNVT